MAAKLSMSAADWLLLVVLSLLWGGSFFFAKVAVEDLPPLTLALGRVAIAAVILAVLTRVRGESLVPMREPGRPLPCLASSIAPSLSA